MSLIQIKNLSFRYDNGIEDIFNDVSVNLDTNWKLGLIGRNGKGKTTLLQILSGKLKYDGIITKNVAIDYFPFKVDENKLTMEAIQDFCMAEDWEIIKELNILNFNIEALYRAYKTLSGGEKVKAMLVALFLKENNFLLIDEPTNHLDDTSKMDVEKYLKNKKGFILVSHDRNLLNKVTDHIMAINNSNIDIIQGNYSVWKEAFDRQNNFELKQNEKLEKEIKKLENASKESKKWSNSAEKEKQNKSGSKEMLDKGFLGHKAAKIMKKSKVLEERKNKNIEETKKLLSNIDNIEKLKIVPLTYEKNELITKAQPRNQADIVRYFKFKTNYNPKDQAVFALLNTILGGSASSRLFNDLRETQKLAYRVESNIDFVGNTGVMALSIKTTTDNPSENIQQYDNVKKSLEGFQKHIDLLKTQPVPIEELDAAKLRIKTQILNSLESSASQTVVLNSAKDNALGINAINNNLKLIDEITPQDIQNAANYIFNSNSITSILASQNTLKNMNIQ